MNDNAMSESVHNVESLQSRIYHLCVEFEAAWAAWRNGERPRPEIEDYLTGIPHGQSTDVLCELLSLQVHLSLAHGDDVPITAYYQRYPQHVVDSVCIPPPEDSDPSLKSGEPAPSTALPRRIGRFEIRQVLGKGGFAIVYLAYDAHLNRFVALKIPRFAESQPAEDRQAFLKEARSLAALDHPGIVRVYDVLDVNGLICIVQQYVDGEDLRTRLQAKKLSIPESVETMISLTEAIGEAHQSGYIHRDLKPANILVDSGSGVHVADFGLALYDQPRSGCEIAGTPAYMSPEQIEGKIASVGCPADVWSLGVMLYQFLCGQLPFYSTDVRDLHTKIMKCDPVPLRQIDRSISRDLEMICMKCLEKDPARRYSDAVDLATDLRRYADGDSATACPLSIWTRTWRWYWHSPKVPIMIAGAYLTGLSFVLIMWALLGAVARSTMQVDSSLSVIGFVLLATGLFLPLFVVGLGTLDGRITARWAGVVLMTLGLTISLLCFSGCLDDLAVFREAKNHLGSLVFLSLFALIGFTMCGLAIVRTPRKGTGSAETVRQFRHKSPHSWQ